MEMKIPSGARTTLIHFLKNLDLDCENMFFLTIDINTSNITNTRDCRKLVKDYRYPIIPLGFL